MGQPIRDILSVVQAEASLATLLPSALLLLLLLPHPFW
jgi:hypothetical protein